MPAPLTHLLFDLDGTLTDPREGITRCYAHALRSLGREPPPLAALERFIGPPTREVMSELLATADRELIEHGVRVYRERFASVGLFENAPYPGVGDVLAALLGRGFALYVCTSKPEVYAVQILDHFELSQFFQRIYGCELDGTRADKADLLAYLVQKESIEPQRAVLIGDRLHDVRAARKSGLYSIGVLYGFGSEAELTQAGADLVCPTLAELPRVIDALS
ncbi:MAG TPA: HAD hydrolase-like protein [Polyangiales bacterium]|nr:HAD hydrolase-like protein [Polyangiales bacterium]